MTEPSSLPDAFAQDTVPELIRTHGTRSSTSVRILTPNYVPKHDPKRWPCPNTRLVFDIRFDKAFPTENEIGLAKPSDLTFLYVASRDRMSISLDVARAIKAASLTTHLFLVACNCNRWSRDAIEAEFGPTIWTPDCGGNRALDEIIDMLVAHWPKN